MGRMENPQAAAGGVIVWTDVFDNPAGSNVAPVVWGNGVTLAVFIDNALGDFEIERSINDGVTWTPQLSLGGVQGAARFLYGDGIWLAVVPPVNASLPSVVYKSIDNGVTWTGGVVNTGLINVSGGGFKGALATNGAGIWVVTGVDNATGDAAISTSNDNGATWTVQLFPALFNFIIDALLWDGSTFATIANDQIGNVDLLTSADGVTWVSSVLSAGIDNFTGGFGFDGTNYLVGVENTANVRVASTLAGLATAPDTPTGLAANLMPNLGVAGFPGALIALAQDATTANSSDGGATWLIGTIPTGNPIVAVGYDPNTSLFIAGDTVDSVLQGASSGGAGGATLSSSCKSGAIGQM